VKTEAGRQRREQLAGRRRREVRGGKNWREDGDGKTEAGRISDNQPRLMVFAPHPSTGYWGKPELKGVFQSARTKKKVSYIKAAAGNRKVLIL